MDWREPEWRAAAAAALAVFFAGLWQGSLDGDPVVYAAVAKGLAESGAWWTLELGGEPYFNKPPLMFWLTAATFRVAGVSTFTACFWSAAFAALACVALYRLGRELFDRPTGLWAAWILCITPDFVRFSTRFRLESVCAFFLILTFLDSLRAVRERSPAPLARAGVWIGLCFMAKGGPGFLALAVVPVLLCWCGAGRLLRTRHAALGLAAAAGLGLLWPLTQWWLHGGAYLEAAIGRELLERVAGDDAVRPASYARVVVARYWPWLPFLALGAWRLVRTERVDNPVAWRVLVVWIAVVLGLLALPQIRYGRYLSSVWPAFALVAGRWIACALPAAWNARVTRAAPALAVAGAAILVLLPIQVHRDRAEATRRLGALLEHHQPGDRAVWTYRESHPFWRGQFAFYLDRDLAVVESLDELERIAAGLVISRRRSAEELETQGWRAALHSKRWTAYLPPARLARRDGPG